MQYPNLKINYQLSIIKIQLEKNAVAFTKRYIDEGLKDRAITRNLDWGIDVPKKGYEDKRYIYGLKMYLVIYLLVRQLQKVEEKVSKNYGSSNARHYYVHGKDNIPFHTIILPALLLAHGETGGCRMISFQANT